jgi:hypothetical protein
MQRIIEEKWTAKRKAEADARDAEQRKAAQEKLELENLLATQELAKQKREAHEREVRRLSDEAFALETAARQAEADALRTSAPAVEEKPVTITDARHPLSMIFGVTQTKIPEPTAPVQAEPVQIELRKESPEEQSCIMASFINKGFRPNPLQVINLLKRFEPSPILNALNIVAADTRLQGRDAVQGIEALLWNPEADPKEILNGVVEAREAEKARREAEREERTR